ncbi:hypothetical protein NDU88_004101 [Pleurodeles waltl]|uniref:Uncharacterized protein n=1 Tax=Pleurodeles waltl TaxID=8319 RepID=A0AAV7WRC4_PLEWA|nr:hypothetical protein NDU88_004101 [Pleurodeles waltl]
MKAQLKSLIHTVRSYTEHRPREYKEQKDSTNNIPTGLLKSREHRTCHKESIQLWDVLNMLDSVTHEMEFEKKKGNAPVSGIINTLNTYANIMDSFKSQRQSTVDTMYQDWREAVSHLSLKPRHKHNTTQKDSTAGRRGILKCNKPATTSSVYTVKSSVYDDETQKSMADLKNQEEDFRVVMNNKSLSPTNHTELVDEKKKVNLACNNQDSTKAEHYITLKTDKSDSKSSVIDLQRKLNSVNYENSEKHNPGGSEITLAVDRQSSTKNKETPNPSSKRTCGLFTAEVDSEKTQQIVGNQGSSVARFQKEGNASSGNTHQNDSACFDQVTQETYSEPSPKADSKSETILNHTNTQESCFRKHRGLTYQCKEVEGIHNRKKHGMKEWISFLNANKYSQERIRKEKLQGAQKKLQRINVKSAGNLKHIGPHVEVYEAFNKVKEEPISRIFAKAAIKIQKWVRGWLVRTKLKRIKAKLEDIKSLFCCIRLWGPCGSILSLRGCLYRRGAVELGAASRGLIGTVIEERPWSTLCGLEQSEAPDKEEGRGPRNTAGPRGCRGRLHRAWGHPRTLPLLRGCRGGRLAPLVAWGRAEHSTKRTGGGRRSRRVPEATAVSCTATRDVPGPGPRLGLLECPE